MTPLISATFQVADAWAAFETFMQRILDSDVLAITINLAGTFTPTEAVELAVERGLTGVAITDHDTLEGLDEAADAASGRVDVVPGIEFSAEYEGASLHVLAYWINPANEELRTELRRLTDTRFRRGELMVKKLQELGYPIDFERVHEIAGGDTIARPHVAQAMVEAGIVPTEKAAFTEEFIADGGRAWAAALCSAPESRSARRRSSAPAPSSRKTCRRAWWR